MLLKKRTSYPSIALLALPLVALGMAPDAPLPEPVAVPCAVLHPAPDASARQLLDDFYRERNQLPAWADEHQRDWLRAELGALADDGLSPADYPLPPAYDACSERQLSLSYLRALLDLRRGRQPALAAAGLWHAPSEVRPDPYRAVLAAARRHAGDPTAAFAAARPSSRRYLDLRAFYAFARRQPPAAWQALPDGPLLKPGRPDARVPLLRRRLAAEGYLAASEVATDEFDPATVLALQRFQRRHGLRDDGLLGPASLAELNVGPLARRDQLRANLERLRWRVDDLREARVLINVAAAELSVIDGDRELWRTRTQVGRPQRATPLLASRIERLTLNPTWTVPPTILREDKLPAIRADLGYLQQHELSVYDQQGSLLDPQRVDWEKPGPILLRQAAGRNNPLGRVALRFANPFSVYLHDTPSQALFDRSPRLFSSGCVRIEAVDELLPWLLAEDELATVRRRIASGETQGHRLSRPVPLLIGYWTAEVDADGRLRFFPDIYGRDPALLAALHGEHP
ncbi:L,D-transpeptidase family protein [Pseudomonas sp. CAU 1711]|uniref:L,D-transpeptidase family protein n=1 Tax=Pseudomonas sp. CAU 1711 TaxID=3140356 RepID=UPI003260BFDE